MNQLIKNTLRIFQTGTVLSKRRRLGEQKSFGQKDADQLSGIVDQVKDINEKIMAALDVGNNKMPKTLAQLNQADQMLPTDSDISKLALLGNESKIKKEVRKAAAVLLYIQKNQAIILGAFEKIFKNLKPLIDTTMEKYPDSKDTPLHKLEAEHDDIGFPSSKDIENGLKKAFVVPNWFQRIQDSADLGKGLGEKAVSFLKNIFTKQTFAIDVDQFSDDFTDLSLSELQEIFEKMNPVVGKTKDTADDTIDGINDVIDSTKDDDKSQSSTEKKADAEEKTTTTTDQVSDQAIEQDVAPAKGTSDIIQNWATSNRTLSKNVSKKQRQVLQNRFTKTVGGLTQKIKNTINNVVDNWRLGQKTLQDKRRVSDKSVQALKRELEDFLLSKIQLEGASVATTAKRSSVISSKSEKTVIRMMESLYRQKLTSYLVEESNPISVYDDDGNLLLGKGLKVKHKESGFLYTVEDVLANIDGETVIKLNIPDGDDLTITRDEFEKTYEV